LAYGRELILGAKGGRIAEEDQGRKMGRCYIEIGGGRLIAEEMGRGEGAPLSPSNKKKHQSGVVDETLY